MNSKPFNRAVGLIRGVLAAGLALTALQACSQEGVEPQAEAAVETAVAAEVSEEVEAKLRERLGGIGEGIEIKTIEVSELPGFYTVELLSGVNVFPLQVSADGEFFLSGDLFQYSAEEEEYVNLVEKRREQQRLDMMDELKEDEMIVFAADGEERAEITVFTDVTCFYCQKLHNEVPALNQAGVTVRYLAYPRQGVNSAGYNKLVTAWCASDPQATLTRLKNQEAVVPENCDDNPVELQYMLGQGMGVRGTPAILLDSGRMLPGYQSAPEILVTLGLEE